MKKILISVSLVLLMVATIFGFTKYYLQKKVVINHVVNSTLVNNNLKNNNKTIRNNLLASQLSSEFEEYQIQTIVKPLEIKSGFFATFQKVDAGINVSAADINIDKESKTIKIEIHIDEERLNTKEKIVFEVNRQFVMGILYANSKIVNTEEKLYSSAKIKNPNGEREARKIAKNNTTEIYKQLRSKNSYFVIVNEK